MSDGTGGSGPIGAMYVADAFNGAIRMITPDGTTVSTLVGKQPFIPDSTFFTNPDLYSPPTPVAFVDAYMNTPWTVPSWPIVNELRLPAA